MAEYRVTDTELTNVANMIRSKGGTSSPLEWPIGFINAIDAISGGGGGGNSWNDPIVRNWDFSNPLNLRGHTTYSSNVETINGWKNTTPTTTELVSGGIHVWQSGSGTRANWYNNFKADNSVIIGKQLTMSVLADDELYSESAVIDSTTGQKITISIAESLEGWFTYNSDGNFAIGFYAYGTASQDILIQAIKLEYGNIQTLCDIVNGTPVLRKHQNNDIEFLFGRYMSVNW